MTRLEQTARNKELVLDFISANEGCTKSQMMETFSLSINQMNNILHALSGEIKLLLVGSQKTRVGTYYIADGDTTNHYQIKPTIEGARVVNAGDILRYKYGYKSPELRKKEFRGVGSAMENDG